MCDIGICDGNSMIYQPVDTILTRVGQSVSCKHVAKAKCIVARQSSSCVTVESPTINEMQLVRTRGPYFSLGVEIRGEPAEPFEGALTVIGTIGASSHGGIISDIQDVKGTFDDAGLMVVQVENIKVNIRSFTIVLSSLNPGLPGQQLDQNKNGVLDNISVFGTVFDAVGVPGAPMSNEMLYGVNLDGLDLMFVTNGFPDFVFRDSCTRVMYQVNTDRDMIFDSNGIPVNVQNFNVPEPLSPTLGSTNPTQRAQ